MDTNANVQEVKQDRSMDYFLSSNVEIVVEETEKVVSKHIKDGEGNPVKWVFKPLTTERLNEIERQSMNKVKVKRGYEEKLDSDKFMLRVAIETTVYPNLKDERMVKSYGVISPLEAVRKLLSSPADYRNFMNIVSEVNGLESQEEEFAEDIDSAKN